MNILPKKRWHVRTKDNIARVRRDEAEAKEKEQAIKEKQELAEREARINFLRKKAGLIDRSTSSTRDENSFIPLEDNSLRTIGFNEHVDLFSDFQKHIKHTNKDSEKEKKEEQEKYEKQIGYLTYLGQDTNEALKLRSWYELAPNRSSIGEKLMIEKDLKIKQSNDPLTLINKLLPPDTNKEKLNERRKRSASPTFSRKESHIKSKKSKEKKQKKDKHKKHKKSKKRKKIECRMKEKLEEKKRHNEEKIEILRKERLRREASERLRQESLLTPKEAKTQPETSNGPRILQKYNSQFNPELAKQNQV